MPDLTALPAMPGGKPKQAPPPLQPGPVPARVQPAGPAPDQAPLASSAAAGAPGSAPARDAGTAAARIEGEGSLRPKPGHGTGSAVIAAGRGADGGPASNGGGPHAGVPAPHAGSNVRAGQQVRGVYSIQGPYTSCANGMDLKTCSWPQVTRFVWQHKFTWIRYLRKLPDVQRSLIL